MSVLDLLGHPTTEPDYTLSMPVVGTWLSDNDRGKWQAHHRTIAAWREAAAWSAQSARLPRLARAFILAELRFTTNRRRDPNNWYPTAKAAIDGLVDAGVFVDDNERVVIGPDMRIGQPSTVGRGALLLHLWALPPLNEPHPRTRRRERGIVLPVPLRRAA
jgi:crossover junction endodeoxyribonuclease RusA